jgi:hypothetical protein
LSDPSFELEAFNLISARRVGLWKSHFELESFKIEQQSTGLELAEIGRPQSGKLYAQLVRWLSASLQNFAQVRGIVIQSKRQLCDTNLLRESAAQIEKFFCRHNLTIAVTGYFRRYAGQLVEHLILELRVAFNRSLNGVFRNSGAPRQFFEIAVAERLLDEVGDLNTALQRQLMFYRGILIFPELLIIPPVRFLPDIENR